MKYNNSFKGHRLLRSIGIFFVLFIVFVLGSYIKPFDLKKHFEGDILASAGGSFPVQLRFVNTQSVTDVTNLEFLYSLRDNDGVTVLSGQKNVTVVDGQMQSEIFLPEDFETGLYDVDLLVGIQGQNQPAIDHAKLKVEKKYFGYFAKNWLKALPFMLLPIFLYFLWIRLRKKTITR